MKRSILVIFGSFLLMLSLVQQPTQAFTDVHPHQEIHKSVEYFLDKGALEDRGAFAADQPISRGLFWKLVMSEVGVSSSSMIDRLPEGVEEDDPLAPYLSKALSQRLIPVRGVFDAEASITEGMALKAILNSKEIKAPKRVSPSFRKEVTGISKRSSYLRYLEAAYASNIIKEKDFQPFSPHKTLTRRKAVQWLHGFADGGEVKESTIDPSRYSTRNPNRGRAMRRSVSDVNISKKSKIDTISVPDGKILESVYSQILSNYRFKDEITQEKKKAMINAAIAAMVEEVGDKYSSYIEPKEVSKFKDNLDGNFEGIGAYVDMIDSKFTIVSPIKGSPAEAAGLLPGDIVVKVDGEAIDGKDIHSITALIKGKAGTVVNLHISRGLDVKEIAVTRGEITVPAIDLKWEKGIPVVGIHQFNRDTGIKLRQLVESEIIPKKPKGLVLDFRNNPGGYLVAAVQVGEVFLRDGREIFSVEYQDNKQTYTAGRTGPLKDMENIVVLQNKGTASASEIVIGMLQDYDRAIVIGENSLGKGTVQNINNYQNGGLLKLTVAKWLTPKGRWIHETGGTPDIKMDPQTVEERRADIDKPLDRAVQHALGNK